MFLPQLVRTYTRGFDGSIATIALALCNGIAWIGYGALRGDLTIVVCNVLLGSSALSIIVRWALDRRAFARSIDSLESALELEDATR